MVMVMAEGYIYILLNRAFQNDHYKIGMTTKTSENRARELSSATGVPREFEVLYDQRVIDCHQAERLLHQRLDQYRSAGNREFFQIPLKAAIKALEDVADEIGRVDGEEELASQPASLAAQQLGEISAATTMPPRKVSAKKASGAIITFEDNASYTDDLRRSILNDLRCRVLSLDSRLRQGEHCTAGQRIAYKIPGDRIFLEIKVQRAAILLRLVDGGCLDLNGLTNDIPASHGWGRLKKQITILSNTDLEAAIPFIEAAYNAKS